MKHPGTKAPAAGRTAAHEQAWCEGKQAFASWSEANAVVRHRKRRGTTGRRGVLEAYRCLCCDLWHLGQP